MCRGLGLPIIDWREIRAERWAADAPGRPVRADRVRRRRRRPAPDGQAVAPRQFGRDDPRPRHRRTDARRSTSPSATTRSPWSERTWPAPATSRSRSSATTRRAWSCTGPARSCPVTSSTTTPRSTRPGCPRRATRAEVTSAVRVRDAQDRARRLSRHRGRRLRTDRLPRRGRRPSTCRRSTRSRASRRSASSRRCRPRAATRSAAVCVRIVELALERHAARVDTRLDRRRPAPMSTRPSARRLVRPDAPRAARSGGPRPGCPGSGPAPPSRCSSRPPAIYGVSSSSAFDLTDTRLTGDDLHGPGRRRPRRIEGVTGRTCSRSRPARSKRPCATCRRSSPRGSPSRCRTRWRRRSRSARRSWSGRSAPVATSPAPMASCSPA